MEISITWNICRVCLVEEEKEPEMVAGEPMRHIFDEDEMLAKQIYECSGIAMKPNDNLPEKLCKKCYKLIKCAVNFRETCRASDTYLQNIMQRTKSASALFKKQEQPSEEIISNDCFSVDKSGDGNEPSPSDKPKCRETVLEQSNKRRIELEYSDLIEFENVEFINENDLKNSVGDNVLDYTVSCINEAIATVKHGDSLQQNGQLNEETEEKQESEEEEDFKESNDDHADSEKDDEENFESFEQFEQFIAQEETNQRDVISDMESENGNDQAMVSSTVAIIEDVSDMIELEAEDTQLSSESNDIQTEYIIDEYMIDDNSCDSNSVQNSSVLFFHPKKAKPAVNKYETPTNRSKPVVGVKTASRTGHDFQVWVCDMCGNHFVNRQILNAHIKVHRQEKNHECEICLKRFITACNLQAHMRIHTGEKPFECKYCGRRFSDRSSNLRHERTHTNERPFECKQCGKAFSLGTTLKKHLKVHTGERSYSCDICAKSFKLPHQLKAHKNSTLHKAVEQLTQMDE